MTESLLYRLRVPIDPMPKPSPDPVSSAPPAPPPALQEWLRGRNFDICPWYPAPVDRVVKVRGKDAWQFDEIVLVRVSLTVLEQRDVRYYTAFQFGPRHGSVVGYWLEVYASTPVVVPDTSPEVTE